MEKIVYQSEFAIAKFEDETQMYTLTYLPATVNMRDEQWKELMTNLAEVTDKLKPKYILDDNSKRMFAYSPELQNWTLQLFIPIWNKNALKKYVQILPTDFINELSAEQIVEMANLSFSEIFENTFVQTHEEAVKWLNIEK